LIYLLRTGLREVDHPEQADVFPVLTVVFRQGSYPDQFICEEKRSVVEREVGFVYFVRREISNLHDCIPGCEANALPVSRRTNEERMSRFVASDELTISIFHFNSSPSR
jgi:hypothetical protein